MTVDLVRVAEAPDHTLVGLDDGKANALSRTMLGALDDAVEGGIARQLPLVLAGRPGVLSGGFDLRVMTGDDAAARSAMVRAGFEIAYKLLAAPVPVVFACTGHAIAMGAFLLLSGDVNVGAAGEFRVGANETALGIVMPEFGIEITRQRLVPAAFTRALLTSELFGPEAARDAGFLDEVVAPDDVVAHAVGRARALAAHDAHVYAATKARVRGPAAAAVRRAIDGDTRLHEV